MRKALGNRLQFAVRKFFSLLFFTFLFLYLIPNTLRPVHAIVDPLSTPNNKFGIHIISATPDESSPAAELVNNDGDWGYITFLIESKDRNENKWQTFFNDLRRRHLIPIVRLATKPLNAHWEKPYEGEEEAWASFLDKLNWPTKNRYVVIYNEPNHGKEWGQFTDPASYAKVLDKTIDALKEKSPDFFVMNAGFDASAPHKPPNYFDEVFFLSEMEKAVSGIFEKLDGWVSHSYPNPEFIGSPSGTGRGTVRTWFWELQQLRNLGVTKSLPVFITETGWKHAEGLSYNPNFPTEDTIASYYKNAFENAWVAKRIVAVTPFLLNYQDPPFDHFSFKQVDSDIFYASYQTIKDMSKIKGKPLWENLAKLTSGEVYSSVVAGEKYTIHLTFENIGQSIWNDTNPLRLVVLSGGQGLGIETVEMSKDVKVEPGQNYTFTIRLKAPQKGSFRVSLNLFEGQKPFDSKPLQFTTQVKEPVILKILTKLKWRDSPAGEYILRTSGTIGESTQKVIISEVGVSEELEARYLLPDYTFKFSLEKPNYKPKTIQQTLKSGENILDFGEMQPDLISNIFNPLQLWKLLPFSN